MLPIAFLEASVDPVLVRGAGLEDSSSALRTRYRIEQILALEGAGTGGEQILALEGGRTGSEQILALEWGALRVLWGMEPRMHLMQVVDGAVDRLRLALNGVFDRAAGGESRPVFFDIASTCPELLALDRAFPVIREELLRVLPRTHELPRYHELDPDQAFISEGQGENDPAWRIFMLYAMRAKPEANRAMCPRTSELLDRVPNLFQAFFSILEPGKSIPQHEGPYKGYVRYHLGLVVPKERPPSIQIKDQVRTWEEGKSFMFDDSWPHQVFNEAAAERVVLIVDILRPMPFLQHRLNHAVSNHLIARLYGKRILEKLTKDLR